MTSPIREGLPVFWSTTLAKVLVGDQPCLLAPWLSGHHQLVKRPREGGAQSLTIWKMNHTSQLLALSAEVRASWPSGHVLKEYFFKVAGKTAIVSGKADLLMTADDTAFVWDIKSGEPRESDVAQVMIEMLLLPLALKRRDVRMAGVVVYHDHRVQIDPSALDEFRPRFQQMVESLASPDRPEASPSRDACRFCDVADDDCYDRWTDADAVVATDLF